MACLRGHSSSLANGWCCYLRMFSTHFSSGIGETTHRPPRVFHARKTSFGWLKRRIAIGIRSCSSLSFFFSRSLSLSLCLCSLSISLSLSLSLAFLPCIHFLVCIRGDMPLSFRYYFLVFLFFLIISLSFSQDAFDHDKGQNLQFRPAVSTGVFELSPVDIFSVFSRFCVYSSKETAQKSAENGENSGWRNLRKILSRL